MGPTYGQTSGSVVNLTTSHNFPQSFCIHIMAMIKEYIFMIQIGGSDTLFHKWVLKQTLFNNFHYQDERWFLIKTQNASKTFEKQNV